MTDDPSLFDALAPEATGSTPRTFGVHELNRRIEATVADAFPDEIWVRGEIKGIGRTRGRDHQYFELVEKEPGANRIRASLPVALLGWNRESVERDLAAVPDFALADDLEVRIRGRLEYFGRFGRLSLHMTGIDPGFTIGHMALTRRRILERLQRAGLLEKNARLPIPAVPLHVGLVTSTASAAYRDFVHEIETSGFAFRIVVVDARVQGRETDWTVLAGLRALKAAGVDLIAVVRGGGSRTDLAAFDSEALARAIAAMPIPVITGIGHEIDDSVVDRVAHTAFKTPTAAAGALVSRVAGARTELDRLAARIAAAAHRNVHTEHAGLVQRSRSIANGTRRALRRHDTRLATAAQTVRQAGARAARRERSRLDALENQVRALDPAGVLARGYSITRRGGHVVKSATEVEPGATVTTQLHDGEIESTVQ